MVPVQAMPLALASFLASCSSRRRRAFFFEARIIASASPSSNPLDWRSRAFFLSATETVLSHPSFSAVNSSCFPGSPDRSSSHTARGMNIPSGKSLLKTRSCLVPEKLIRGLELLTTFTFLESGGRLQDLPQCSVLGSFSQQGGLEIPFSKGLLTDVLPPKGLALADRERGPILFGLKYWERPSLSPTGTPCKEKHPDDGPAILGKAPAFVLTS